MSLNDFIHNKPTIHSDRLVLRPLQESDVETLREWCADASIYQYWGKKAGKLDKDPSLMFAHPERPTKSFHLGLELRTTGKVIGELWVYLIENDRMAKLAIRISPKFHGQGIATEAIRSVVTFCFTSTELQRLWTDVDVRNTASVRVLEKCGFVREGLIRQGKMVNTWCDHYIYGLLSSDPIPYRK